MKRAESSKTSGKIGIRVFHVTFNHDEKNNFLRFPWLEQMADGSENAFCTLCCKILQPKLSTIINHSNTTDHHRQVIILFSFTIVECLLWINELSK